MFDRAASYCMGKLRMLIGLTQLQCKFTRFKIQIQLRHASFNSD